MSFVLPGTDLTPFIEEKCPKSTSNGPEHIHVGPGIIQTSAGILALRAGLLHASHRGNKFTLSGGGQRRYLPQQNDLVIGVVTAKLGEVFRVDIGGPQTATLPLLTGFEGATRKTRPVWPVGTVIFARVSLAHPDLEPELACFDPSGNVPADVFGELGLGSSASVGSESSSASSNPSNPNPSTTTTTTTPSVYSQLIRTSCPFSKSLQNPSAVPLLSALGRRWAFEVAAGANGRICVTAASAKDASAIARVIEGVEREGVGAIETLMKE